MDKILVKIFVNGKDLCSKKFKKDDTLSEVRKKINLEKKKNLFFMNEDSPISIEDENEVQVGDILKNKNIYLKGESLKLYINDEYIIDVDLSKEDPLKNLIEKYSKDIPSDFEFLDKDKRTIKKEDVINDEDILIDDVLIENIIYLVTKNNESKKKTKSDKVTKEEPKNSKNKLTVNIYLNNKLNAMKKFDPQTTLSELRKSLSDFITEKSFFVKEGIKITDEDDFSISDIIKNDSIYIIDDNLSQKQMQKEESSLNSDSGSLEKNDEFKIMSIIENGKKTKSKKINVKEPLSELRNQLDLPLNASFLNNGLDIEIKDESIFYIMDIIKDDSIYIKREESKLYTIYFNDQILTKQNLEPSKDVSSLRNLLSLQINEKAYFINANTKEKINIEDEQFQLLSKISSNDNEIFIKQEVEIKKKVNELIKGSELLKEKGHLKIYKYNCVPEQYIDKLIKEQKLNRREDYNGEIFDMNDEAESKTIIVLGQTGSGKTTLLNSFVNFILGVEFEDDFRYVIIDEKNVQGFENVDQTKSVTQNTTIYYIKKYKDYPSIILIDTPGFGDTSGPDKDKIIISDIKNTFETKLTKIDAICFVAQSSNVRLTANQNYIFSSVMSLFGKDIAENFIPMLTFCDADDWDLGMASFVVFIEKLKNLPQKSLESSKNVLRQRQYIEDDIINFKKKLDEGLGIMQEIESTRVLIQKNEQKIKDSKNFTYTVKVAKYKEVPLKPGIHTTNCLTCNRTCHKNCSFADNADKKKKVQKM